MKIVFFGSSNFAVPSLEQLINSDHHVLAVVTQPDRKKGRDLKLAPTPVKEAAISKGIDIYQPEDACGKEALKFLKSLKADIFVVVAFGQILSKEVLGIPRRYSINAHPSLLPKYRGAAPVNWSIIKGDTKTGLTLIRMNEKMDAGDIMLQRKIEITKEDNAQTLNDKLSYLGSILLLDGIRFIELDKIVFRKQNKKAVTLAPRLKKEDGLIDWKKPARAIHNMVRGLVPWPCAFTLLSGKTLKVWKTEVMSYYNKPEPGRITDIYKDNIYVSCGKEALIIKELQLEGSKRMDSASFARGHKLEKNMYFGDPPKEAPPKPDISENDQDEDESVSSEENIS